MSRSTRLFILKAATVASLASPALAHADSVLLPPMNSANPALPSIPAMKQGEPFRLTWPDGRQAVLRVKKTSVYQIPLKLAVTENLCEDRVARPAPKCVYRLSNQEITTDLAWEKHPDVTKIGQTLKYVNYYQNSSDGPRMRNEILMDRTDYASSGSVLVDPKFTKDGLYDELICDDFHWLTGSEEKGAPDQIVIDAWNSEFMLVNPETMESENRYFGNGYGVKFVKSGPQSLRLVGAQSLGSSFGGSPSLFGDVISLVLRQNSGPNAGETCQVTIKPNIGEATQAARQIQEEAGKNAKFAPVTDFDESYLKKFFKDRNFYLTTPILEGGFE